MKIIILSARLPYPPNSGFKIRLFNLLQPLATRHQIELLSLLEPEDDLSHVKAIEEMGITVHAVRKPAIKQDISAKVGRLVATKPRFVAEHTAPTLARALAKSMSEHPPDIIQCEQVEMAQYGAAIQTGRTLLTELNIESELLQRMALARPNPASRLAGLMDAVKMRRYERHAWRHFDGNIAVSEEDAAKMRLHSNGRPVWVVPNGVDTTHFVPNNTPPLSKELAFTGTLGYYPNLDGLRFLFQEIWPRMREQIPEIHLSVVGTTNDVAEQLVQGQPGVTLVGQVPDVRPFVARAQVFIVPLRIGGGTRLKILEALAQGIPIVSTTAGAEGLGVIDQEHLLIADDAPAFVAAVVRLLGDEVLRQRLAQNGRRFVVERFDWQGLAKQQEQVYEDLLEHRRR